MEHLPIRLRIRWNRYGPGLVFTVTTPQGFPREELICCNDIGEPHSQRIVKAFQETLNQVKLETYREVCYQINANKKLPISEIMNWLVSCGWPDRESRP